MCDVLTLPLFQDRQSGRELRLAAGAMLQAKLSQIRRSTGGTLWNGFIRTQAIASMGDFEVARCLVEIWEREAGIEGLEQKNKWILLPSTAQETLELFEQNKFGSKSKKN